MRETHLLLQDVQTGINAVRSLRAGLLASSAFRSFRRLHSKYDPNQPRDGRGRWTSGGSEEPETTGSTAIVNDATTGDLEIDSVTTKLLTKLSDIVEEIGPGSGFLYGIRVHLAFADAVRRSGIAGLEAETTWFDGMSIFQYGLAGSIRTDAVLRSVDDPDRVKAIWDVKTGRATLGPARARAIRDHVGGDFWVPIIELNVFRGVMIKADAGLFGRNDMDVSDLLIVTQREVGRSEWQAAIDRAGYPVPLAMGSPTSTGAGDMSATFGGRPVIIRFTRVDIADLPRRPTADYKHAFAISGRGELRESAARLAAALAYASAAGGMGYVPETGEVKPLDNLRTLVDGMLTAVAGAGDDRSGTIPTQSSGSMTIRARRAP